MTDDDATAAAAAEEPQLLSQEESLFTSRTDLYNPSVWATLTPLSQEFVTARESCSDEIKSLAQSIIVSNDDATLVAAHWRQLLDAMITWHTGLDKETDTYVASTTLVQETFETALYFYPTSVRLWIEYCTWMFNLKHFAQLETLFSRCLRMLPSVPLWQLYLNYVKQVNPVAVTSAAPVPSAALVQVLSSNSGQVPTLATSQAATGANGVLGAPNRLAGVMQDSTSTAAPSTSSVSDHEARQTQIKAYEFALSHVGIDVDAITLWTEYLDLIRSAPANGLFEEQVRMDSTRKLYQRACAVPLQGIENIWKAYDAFENALNKQLARKILSEKSPLYMTARAAVRELKQMLDPLERVESMPVPPQGTARDSELLIAWKKWIAWEKTDPLRLEDKNVLHQRITFAYKQCLLSMHGYNEIWYDFAVYLQQAGRLEEASHVLQSGCVAMKTSCVVHMALAELELLRQRNEAAKKVYESLLTHLSEALSNLESTLDEGTASKVHDLKRQLNLTFIQYMNFTRRAEGIAAARLIFRRARNSPHCTYHVFVASALMEYYCSKDKQIAFRIFELGMRSFGDEPRYVLAYLQHLIHLNDDSNTRAVFERTLSAMAPQRAAEIWTLFISYESRYGDLAAVLQLEKRRTESATHALTPFALFLERAAYDDLLPMSEIETEVMCSRAPIEMVPSKTASLSAAQAAAAQSANDAANANSANANASSAAASTGALISVAPRHVQRFIRPDTSKLSPLAPTDFPAGPSAAASLTLVTSTEAPKVPLPESVHMFMARLPPVQQFDGQLCNVDVLLDYIRQLPLTAPAMPSATTGRAESEAKRFRK